MALTLSEAVQFGGYTGLERGVIKMFAMSSPILEIMPFDSIEGDSITYRQELALPTVSWRPVNSTYSNDNGTVQPYTEKLFILGGEVKIDNFIVATQGKGDRSLEIKANQYRMKAQAAANAFDQAFFEGDDLVDQNSLVGLRRRLTGSQVLLQATNGGPLTLPKLDELIDLVPFDNKHLFMNRTMRRKITALVQATSGSTQIVYQQDSFGRQQMKYADIPIHIVERSGDASSILGFDETAGTSAVCSSLYCVSFGSDRVGGLYNGTKVATVHDFGEMQAEPTHLGRIEAFYGMYNKHPRAAARLRGVDAT